MRCVIAGFAFELTDNGVREAMQGIDPEPVAGVSVLIGPHHYPVKQVGAVVSGQNRRDFTADEIGRAFTRLGFTLHGLPHDARRWG